ncbi:MAG: NAD(P)H-quinone oxidoreductase subunit M [Synechococcus sp.]|nr:NAD(P)H-quinone oxidoreductase subunit M [Synechococcus sp.]
MAETLLKCTTRHVRLFTARIVNDDLVPSDNELTLDLDPDNEFIWTDAVVSKVQLQFKQLVEAAGTGELSDYTLRRIGTDLEGYIRQLLQAGELSYNPDGRVQNFSMGLPRTPELL